MKGSKIIIRNCLHCKFTRELSNSQDMPRGINMSWAPKLWCMLFICPKAVPKQCRFLIYLIWVVSGIKSICRDFIVRCSLCFLEIDNLQYQMLGQQYRLISTLLSPKTLSIQFINLCPIPATCNLKAWVNSKTIHDRKLPTAPNKVEKPNKIYIWWKHMSHVH